MRRVFRYILIAAVFQGLSYYDLAYCQKGSAVVKNDVVKDADIDKQLEQLRILHKSQFEQLKKTTDDFFSRSKEALESEADVKNLFSDYMTMMTETLKIFDETSPFMSRINNLLTEYSVRQEQMVKKAKLNPPLAQSYQEMSDGYGELGDSLRTTTQEIRDLRKRAGEAHVKFMSYEQYLIDLIIYQRARASVDKLKELKQQMEELTKGWEDLSRTLPSVKGTKAAH